MFDNLNSMLFIDVAFHIIPKYMLNVSKKKKKNK